MPLILPAPQAPSSLHSPAFRAKVHTHALLFLPPIHSSAHCHLEPVVATPRNSSHCSHSGSHTWQCPRTCPCWTSLLHVTVLAMSSFVKNCLILGSVMPAFRGFLPSFSVSLMGSLLLWVGRAVRHGWVDLARSGRETQPSSDTAPLDILQPPPQLSSPAFPSFIDSLNKYLSSTNHMPNTVPDPGDAAMKDESVVFLPPVCTGLQFTPLQPIHLLERSDRSCHSLLMKSLQWLALFLSPAPQHGIYLVLIYLSGHSPQRTLQSHRTAHNFPNTHTLSCLFAFTYSASLPPSRTPLLIFLVWQNLLCPSQLSKNVISPMTPCQHPICCSHCTNSLNHLSL